MSVTVILTADEIFTAAAQALLRRHQMYAGERGQGERKQRHAAMESTWDEQIESTCAELAWCKLRKVFWAGMSKVSSMDAADGVEVKWTKYQDAGGLIVQPHANEWHVLMDGRAPTFRAVGYMNASEAKQPQWLDKAGYYLVPRSQLHPFKSKSEGATNGHEHEAHGQVDRGDDAR